ncbi:MAG TPA: DUF1223 domain-containing protein [Acidobacteriaceae bacterium]|nr:DUF1223 domain-containing protein [Acidobacteriaceae bacterium]
MALSRLSRSSVLLAAIVATLALCIALARHNSNVYAAKRAKPPAQPVAAPVQHPGANPVIVELFTSEGCSSCPPADALLAKLQQDQPVPSANIIALEEHVDYWDHLGWKDRFSSPYVTQRQRNYQSVFHLDDIYTPQFVVNGSSQFDGTNPSAINSAIAKASADVAPLQIVEVHVRNGASVSFKLANPAIRAKYVNLYAAIIEPQDNTNVKNGENAGRALQHINVVRAVATVGAASRLEDFDHSSFRIQLPVKSRLVAPRLVVFAQSNNFGPILGAAVHTITAREIDPTPKPTTTILLSPTIPSCPSSGSGDFYSASCGLPSPLSIP